MSKSLGNFVTINEVLRTDMFGGRSWSGETMRLAMLRSHYRQPMDWTVKALEEAEKTLDKWSAQIASENAYGISLKDGSGYGDPFGPGDGSGFGKEGLGLADVVEALTDDLNTPSAIAFVHSLSNPFELLDAVKFLGIDLRSYERKRREERENDIDRSSVEALIATRTSARKEKKWAESDRIRDELAALGVAIKDNKDGTTTWEVKR
jgi:cysteinyl-tRNA synthetase